MTTSISSLREDYGPIVTALNDALAAGDEALFQAQLDALVHRREADLFKELRKLTSDLQSALERFRVDSRLVDLAEKEVPNAKHRLDHVLKLTDEAAHRTMDLVEECRPLADRTAKQAGEIMESWRLFRARKIEVKEFQKLVLQMDEFLAAARSDMEKVRGNLAEVVLAQGYQDLSGQIIRGVMKLVDELEHTLVGLVRLSRTDGEEARQVEENPSRGFGPVVPGVDHGAAVSGQQDVDSLLAGLGV
jgi:chemotaxis protein CheZ